METSATPPPSSAPHPIEARPGISRRYVRMAISLAMLAGTAITLLAILPVWPALILVAIYAWSIVPGLLVVRRVYGAGPGSWAQALLVGPAWGFPLTSLVLLAMWVAGIRSVPILLLAPAVASLAAIPAGRMAGSLTVPAFTRRDLVAIAIVLAVVPIVVGRPYARVGEMRPEGRAYRAYFIADFEWAMTVAAEVGKGDVPPKNPFLSGESLHYYWLANLISAIEHRESRRSLTLEQVLLCNAVLLDLAFMAFLYAFVRHFVHSPPAAAAACVAVVLCSSFEGTYQLYLFWARHVPLDAIRDLNIDAVTRWRPEIGSLPVDGLQRLLLYQPHHATAWALGLSGLLVLLQARDARQVRVSFLAGLLLCASLLTSSFLAVMVGAAAAVYQFVRLVWLRAWRAIVLCGLAAAVPVGGAVLATSALQYVDPSAGKIVYFGANKIAANHALVAIILSFGPMIAGALVGLLLAGIRRAARFGVLALLILVGFAFYFFVDVIDHQHVYVGWRAGHLLFMAFTPLVGFALQELWAGGLLRRGLTAVVAGALALAALPMTVVDLYNTQDTSNAHQGPGFKWTAILTPDELDALDWVKKNTPADARIQIDPSAHDGNETWAYIPAFAERRMAAGIPISMIPVQKYRVASEPVTRLFAETDPPKAYEMARALGVQYLYVGPAERVKFPRADEMFSSAPLQFRPMFRSATVSIYYVEGSAPPETSAAR